MAGETVITVVGNLAADVELRFTQQGTAVANVTVASTPRFYDKEHGGWRDGEAMFLRGSMWRQLAENAAESLTKGDRVIVQGKLKQRSFETQSGERRTVVEIDIEEIGPSIKFAQAALRRVDRSRPALDAPAAPDPWNTEPPY